MKNPITLILSGLSSFFRSIGSKMKNYFRDKTLKKRDKEFHNNKIRREAGLPKKNLKYKISFFEVISSCFKGIPSYDDHIGVLEVRDHLRKEWARSNKKDIEIFFNKHFDRSEEMTSDCFSAESLFYYPRQDRTLLKTKTEDTSKPKRKFNHVHSKKIKELRSDKEELLQHLESDSAIEKKYKDIIEHIFDYAQRTLLEPKYSLSAAILCFVLESIISTIKNSATSEALFDIKKERLDFIITFCEFVTDANLLKGKDNYKKKIRTDYYSIIKDLSDQLRDVKKLEENIFSNVTLKDRIKSLRSEINNLHSQNSDLWNAAFKSLDPVGHPTENEKKQFFSKINKNDLDQYIEKKYPNKKNIPYRDLETIKKKYLKKHKERCGNPYRSWGENLVLYDFYKYLGYNYNDEDAVLIKDHFDHCDTVKKQIFTPHFNKQLSEILNKSNQIAYALQEEEAALLKELSSFESWVSETYVLQGKKELETTLQKLESRIVDYIQNLSALHNLVIKAKQDIRDTCIASTSNTNKNFLQILKDKSDPALDLTRKFKEALNHIALLKEKIKQRVEDQPAIDQNLDNIQREQKLRYAQPSHDFIEEISSSPSPSAPLLPPEKIKNKTKKKKIDRLKFSIFKDKNKENAHVEENSAWVHSTKDESPKTSLLR